MKPLMTAFVIVLVCSAWGAGKQGEELLASPDGFTHLADRTVADSCRLEKVEAGYQGRLFYRVTKPEGGFVLKYDGLGIVKGKTYTLSLMGKAKAPVRFGVQFGLPDNPYARQSTKKEMIGLTKQWRPFSIDLAVAKQPASPAALVFSMYSAGTFELADISLREDLSPETDKHLFILSGQSNMQGHRPDEAFAPTVKAAFGRRNVIVVQDAMGGQPIQRWYKGWMSPDGKTPDKLGDLYDRLLGKVRAEIAGKTVETVTFIWMQGERDAKMQWGEVYETSIKGLIKQLADDLGRDDLNVVIGRLSDFDMGNKRYPHWTMVRDVQVRVAEASSYGAWVNTDDLNDGANRRGRAITNDLHYSLAGYEILGKRFAESAIALITKRASGDE